jgi:hypothetical protein
MEFMRQILCASAMATQAAAKRSHLAKQVTKFAFWPRNEVLELTGLKLDTQLEPDVFVVAELMACESLNRKRIGNRARTLITCWALRAPDSINWKK